MIDWNLVNSLLQVIHNASTAGPKFTSIAQQAHDELMAHMVPHAEDEDEGETEDE